MSAGRRPSRRALALTVGTAVARRPALWRVALRQWRRTVPTAWWRRRPFLPVPTAEYLAFRLATHGVESGTNGHAATASDVVDYLTWCKGQR